MVDYRKLFDLTGRRALVLGAGSGIGRASAEALGALGADVFCADLDEAGAKATASAIRAAGRRAEAARADAASGGDIAALVATAKTAFSGIDIAVTTPGSISASGFSTTARRSSTASSISISRARSSSSRRSAR